MSESPIGKGPARGYALASAAMAKRTLAGRSSHDEMSPASSSGAPVSVPFVATAPGSPSLDSALPLPVYPSRASTSSCRSSMPTWV